MPRVSKKVSFKSRKSSSVKPKRKGRSSVKKSPSVVKTIVKRKASTTRSAPKASTKTFKNPKAKTHSFLEDITKNAYNAYKAGHSLGGPLGGIGAGLLGGAATAGYGLLTGHGAYRGPIKQNTIAIPGSQIPSFDSKGKSCTRVKHREYLFDITGTTNAFVNNTLSLNPGNKLFPWLSSVAANFEEYSWSGLVFEFRSTSGNSVGTTNTTLGYVAMGTEYNATLPAYSSKLQLENSEFSCSAPPSANLAHEVECERAQTVLGELYVNTGANLQTNQDQRLYDLGTLNYAIGNNQSSATILGELWVTYDVCLYKPKIGYSTTQQLAAHFQATTGFSTTAYFGTSPTITAGSNFAPILTGTTISFPANTPLGNYQFMLLAGGASNNTVTPTVTYSGGCSGLNLIASSAASSFGSVGSACSTQLIVGTFKITAVNPLITFSGGTLLSAPSTTVDLFISALPLSMIT